MSSVIVEPLYVADTHALFWYLTQNRKLGTRAREVFAAAERGEARIVISAIVLAELYYLNEKFNRPLDYDAAYSALEENAAFRFVSFDSRDVLDFTKDSAVSEMHDRVIAGLARRLDVPVLTRDPVIVASGVVQIEW